MLGRFTSIDPLWEKYRSLSPYNYCANNPLMFIDPSGMVLDYADQASQTLFDELYNASSPETQAKYDVLRNSSVTYHININASTSSMPQQGMAGVTIYNFTDNRVDIMIEANVGNKVGTLGDELTHAGQFESGEIGYLPGGKTMGYDMEDEVASKQGYIEATNAYNTAYGTNLQLSPSVAAFQQASGSNTSIQQYFGADDAARRYGFDTRGAQMGVHIPGNRGYSQAVLQQAVSSGQISGIAYRLNGQTIVLP